jgi:hypothetical protein
MVLYFFWRATATRKQLAVGSQQSAVKTGFNKSRRGGTPRTSFPQFGQAKRQLAAALQINAVLHSPGAELHAPACSVGYLDFSFLGGSVAFWRFISSLYRSSPAFSMSSMCSRFFSFTILRTWRSECLRSWKILGHLLEFLDCPDYVRSDQNDQLTAG